MAAVHSFVIWLVLSGLTFRVLSGASLYLLFCNKFLSYVGNRHPCGMNCFMPIKFVAACTNPKHAAVNDKRSEIRNQNQHRNSKNCAVCMLYLHA